MRPGAMTTEGPDGSRRFRERLHGVREQGHGGDRLSLPGLAADAASARPESAPAVTSPAGKS